MTAPVRISNSEIQTFKDCRRRWYFTYYRRLQPKQQKSTGPLALGTRIHESLDQYYALGTPLIDAHNGLVELEKSRLLSEFKDVEALESEAELGHIMLEGYLQWVEENGIDVELDIISTEEVVTVPLFNGEVELTGKLDMRVRRKIDGVRMFRDFKTVGGSLSEFASLAHMNEQVLTYMTLESLKEGEDSRSEGGLFTLLKKVKRTAAAKPPFYDQIEVRHNIFTMRSFWDRLHGTVADIMRVRTALDAGESPAYHVYPRPSRDCKWKCVFYSVCTLVDDGSAAEQAISELYDVSDPYAYYGGGETKGTE